MQSEEIARCAEAMEAARKFAEEWIGHWNKGDLSALMAHYDDDVLFYSPRVAARFEAAGVGTAGGKISGKGDLQEYFAEV